MKIKKGAIKEILKKNKDGLTINEISKALNVSRDIAIDNLKELKSTGQIRIRKVGKVTLCYLRKKKTQFKKTKTKPNKIPYLQTLLWLLVVVLFLALALFAVKYPPFIGLFTTEKLLTYSQPFNLRAEIDQSQIIEFEEYTADFNLVSFKLSGELIGEGQVKVFLEDLETAEKFLILDSERFNDASGEIITGRLSEETTPDSTSSEPTGDLTSEIELTGSPESSSPSETESTISDTSLNETETPPTETPSESENQISDSNETSPDETNLTLTDTQGNETNENKTQEENITSSEYTGEIGAVGGGEPKKLGVTEFKDVCIETCLLPLELKSIQYKLVFEVDSATLIINEIEYVIRDLTSKEVSTNITNETIFFSTDIEDSENNKIGATIEFIDFETGELEAIGESEETPDFEKSIQITGDVLQEKPGEQGLEIPKGKYKIKVKFQNHPVKEIVFDELEINQDVIDFIEVDDIPETKVDLNNIIEAYAIDPTNFNFDQARVTATARGTQLYKCRDWNFKLQSCYGEWVLFKTDLVPGQDYTFILTPEDPGFAEIIITKAMHLDENRIFTSDIYPEVKELDGVWSEAINSGEYVRVTFERNLTSVNDITIHPRTVTGNPRIEVYEENSTATIAEFTSLNDNQYNKVFLTGLFGIQDTFDLRVFDGSVEFDHIIDPVTAYQAEDGDGDCGTETQYTSFVKRELLSSYGVCNKGEKYKQNAAAGGIEHNMTLAWLNNSGYASNTNVTGQASGSEIFMKSKTTDATGYLKLVEVNSNNAVIIQILDTYSYDMAANTNYLVTDLSMLTGVVNAGNTFGILMAINPVGSSRLETKWGSYGTSGKQMLINVNETEILTGDTSSPSITSLTESPTDPATYLFGQIYEFNATITDDVAVDTVIIEFDGINFTVLDSGLGVYNFTTSNLAAGIYNYIWYANDTGGNVNNTEIGTYTINKVASSVNLLLDGADGNLTVEKGTTVNLTSQLITGEDIIELYQEETLINSGTSPLTNFTLFDTVGTFNITVSYPASQNYTTSSETHFVIVQDTTAPTITIYNPTATTYSTTSIDLNVSADETIDIWQYKLNDAANVTFTPNTTIIGLEGSNSLIVYANDTSGSLGSESVSFTVDTTPSPEIEGPFNGRLACAPNWICSGWSACTNEIQTRTCTDFNNCGIIFGKPGESMLCDGVEYVNIKKAKIEMQAPKEMTIDVLKQIEFDLSIRNIIGRPLRNIDIEFEVSKPDLMPIEIHSRPTFGWGKFAKLIMGMSIKGEINYDDLLKWKLDNLHYDSIGKGQSIKIPVSIIPPVFENKDQKIRINIFENREKILSYDLPVELSSKEFLAGVEPGKNLDTKEIYIYYNNKNKPEKEVVIEFSINQGNKNLILDYFGPYDVAKNGEFLIAQEYEFSKRFLSRENLNVRLRLRENGRIIDETETSL